MYVRWKVVQPRPSTATVRWGQYVAIQETQMWRERKEKESKRLGPTIIATLVENRRIDGKPRQKHIAYLAGDRELRLTHPIPQLSFYERAKAKLDTLGLPDWQVERLLAQIAERVPVPSKSDVERAHAEFETFMNGVAAKV